VSIGRMATRDVARPSGKIGVVGAILIVVGLALVGAAFIVSANAESQEINCEANGPQNNCQSVDDNAQNASITTDYAIGAGLVVTGVGAGMVVLTLIGIMAARLDSPPAPAWPPAPPYGSTAGMGLPPSPPPPRSP
jgi:hypothetical protein